MDLTTPNALKPHVLQAACDEAGWDPACLVRGSVVVARALELAGVRPEHAERATRNANWVATQTLRKEGLLGPSDKRGYWTVTPAGIAAGGGGAPSAPTSREDSDPSPWADDPEGLASAYPPARAEYHPDPYICVLAATHTPCFGAYLAEDATCQTCPVSTFCQEVQFIWLNEHVQTSSPPPKPTLTDTPRTVAHSILDDIESGDDPPVSLAKPLQDTFTTATRGSKCYQCGAPLSEGINVVWVPGMGVRHIMPCTRP